MKHLLVIAMASLVITAKCQSNAGDSPCTEPATIVLFRTFDVFNFKFSYRLFYGDSLLGRMKEHGVYVVKTFNTQVSFGTTVKAPSLNAGKRGNFQKIKKINYPFRVAPGEVYFVRCGFLRRDLFEYPRQPTIRLLKHEEVERYLRRRFVRKKIRRFLYKEWVAKNHLGIQP